MAVDLDVWHSLNRFFLDYDITLVAVSKTKPAADVQALYNAGQRHFGENYVQELVDKQAQLPKDINWHFIGHLQSNKVKYIAPFVYLVHGVDSIKLLREINKQGKKINRRINCLLQVHIAQEETKFGMDANEVKQAIQEKMEFASVCGLMGMASFSNDEALVRNEFNGLKKLFDEVKSLSPEPDLFKVLSMGMSGDYKIAVEAGSTMVRIGSMLFGARG
jgi:PLP dependent protein